MKIAILHNEIQGNASLDSIDTLVQCEFIKQKILELGYKDVEEIIFYNDVSKTIKCLQESRPDLVFNLVESCNGFDRLLTFATQVLDCLNISYTGNKTFSNFIGLDKYFAKQVLLSNNILTPKGFLFENISQAPLNKTYILKARGEHASVGITDKNVITPRTTEEFKKAFEELKRDNSFEYMAEEYIDGREFIVGILVDDILPTVEMKFSEDFKGYKILTYASKWCEETDDYINSNRCFEFEQSVKDKLISIANTCKDKLGFKGYTRIDFRMNSEGNLYVIDINPNPCIAPDSGFIAMAEKMGLSHEEIIKRILEDGKIL